MAQHRIDLDRGVSIRQIVKFNDKNPQRFDLSMGGLTVFMYKSEPGKYFDIHGREVTQAIAKMAGFPVEKMAKKRAIMEAKAKAMRDIELALESDDVEGEVVLAENGNWKVIELPAGRAKVVDIDTGESVTPVPLPQQDALLLLQKLSEETLGGEEVVKAKGKKE